MSRSSLKSALTLLLIFMLLLSPNLQSMADTQKNLLHVAFVGLKFKNLPQALQDEFISRISNLLKSNASIVLTKPDGALKTFGSEAIGKLIDNQDVDSFRTFANQYQFDHLFTGTLENQNTDGEPFFLVGELIRFDAANERIHRYMINKEYSKISNELNLFQKQFVQTLAKEEKSKRSFLSALLVGGIVTAAILTFRFTLGSAGAAEENPDAIKVDE